MTETLSVRATVRTYHESWTHGDMARARSCLADNLAFQGPIDRFGSADQFIPALGGFASMLERVDQLQEFYTDTGAALLYDCVTRSPAGTIRCAEFFELENGKIARIQLVFDATELRRLMNR